MTNPLVELKLGDRGLRYVTKQLALGHSLAAHVGQSHDLARANAITYLPSGTPRQVAYEFEEGILEEPPPETHVFKTMADGSVWRGVKKPNLDQKLVSIIGDYLKSSQGKLCIFEDHGITARDVPRYAMKTRIVTHREEVYHLLFHRDAPDTTLIETTIGAARSWFFLCVLTEAPWLNEQPEPPGRVTDRELEMLGMNAKGVIVGAYDGEGFLLSHLPNN